MMKKDISVVIPAYNERENIPVLMSQLEKIEIPGKSFEVIFVDDGSNDGSFETLRDLKKRGADIRIIRFRRNFGQTAAIAAGFDHAVGDIIITMDADLQNDPADIPVLVSEMEKGYDVVSGWRTRRKDNLLARKIPSWFANAIISRYTGVRLHDYGCTLKAYKKELTEDINLYGELHRFMPALMSWQGAAIKEIPVNHRQRRYGKSKYDIFRTVNVILDLLTVKFLLSSTKGPMQIFGRMGLWSVLSGVLSGFATIAMKLIKGTDMTGNPLLYLAVFFVFAGMQFISTGLLGEINIRIYSESRGKKIYAIREIL